MGQYNINLDNNNDSFSNKAPNVYFMNSKITVCKKQGRLFKN